MAQFQKLSKDKLTQDLIRIIATQPTMELAHKERSVICHIQARVNQAANNPSESTSATDPTHLFEKVATPLNNIKAHYVMCASAHQKEPT
jgi:hypothetical protein